MPHLSLSLLGGFKITLDGRPVTAFGTDKVRALLAYLAVESAHPHRRGMLAGMFWPELPQERAAHNLSQSLLRLRRALHEDKSPAGSRSSFLQLATQEVQFNPLSDYQLDVTDFLELVRAFHQHKHANTDVCQVCLGWLRQAADLYHGDLLAGFTLRDSLPFEEWQLVQQEALRRQALEVLSRLADHYEQQGDPDRVLEYARRLVEIEPWHERAQLQLMMALTQRGQDAAALDHYVTHSQLLAREFGAAPAHDMVELYERIRSRQLTDRFARGTATGAATVPDERRQVTALLCQWQNLASSADPDDLQDDLLDFERSLAQTSERYGGWQQPRHGSEFLVYFGYPVAQEDAAQRAVGAALTLVAALRDPHHVRIGLHTGMMVSRGHELVGNVPDLARDCLRLAEPDSVLITADTERLVRSRFTCQPMGLADPIGQVLVYRVHAETAELDRTVWLNQTRRHPHLIGREDELQQLAACRDRVYAGQGQVITICGEPGIGKTRLTREFKQMCPWPAMWLESRCSTYFQNTSLYPIIDLVEQLLGFAPGDDTARKREKLMATLVRDEIAYPDTTWLLSLLLGLPTAAPAPQTITEEQRERMREACVTLIQREAARQPVMMLIEDLHWADPTTIAWIVRSLEALAAARCVLWLNWRPEFVAPWLPRPYVLSLNLEPLNSLQASSLVNDVAGLEMLSGEVCQQIVRQADGIPLFLEELTQTILVQSGLDDTPPLKVAQVPATLRDSLTTRLDRSGAAKVTAQWAAVIGREFAYPLVRAVVPFPEQRLQEDLANLLASGLIVARDAAPHHNYSFKHALIQEATYDSLLKRTRQDYHGRIAETLATVFPNVAETQPEVLAEHYSRAGLAAQAADRWLSAGERAMARGATLEARKFFERSLAEIEPADRERRWRVLLAHEAVLDLREERAAQREDIDALLKLAEALHDDARRAQALLLQANYANRMENYQLMLQASEAAAVAAIRQGDSSLEMQALSRKVMALARLEQWNVAGPLVDELFARLPGITDVVIRDKVLSALGLYYSDVGDIARALLLRQRSIELARRAGDHSLESRQLMSVGYLYTRLGLYTKACAIYEQGLALAETLGDRYLQTNLKFDWCYALWCSGDRDRAQALGERALQELKTSGYRPLAIATCLFYLGLIVEDIADYHTAVTYLAESRTLHMAGGLHAAGLEIQAVEARCRLALGQRAEAQQLASGVWDFLRTHGTVTMDYPSRVYLCIADVVAQVHTPDITEREVLEAGYVELMQRAEMIEDSAWRRSFLEDEISNRALVERWQSLTRSTGASSAAPRKT